MLKWALIFLVISLIAGFLGFSGVSAATATIAKVLFVIALVMQALDNSLTTSLAPRRLGIPVPARLRRMTSRQGSGEPNPTWIPSGHRAATLMAEELGGVAGGQLGDLVNMPMTAHFLGGCAIGTTVADGVLDPYQRVHGYPTLHVLDGAAVTANLGVNPSLTITAQAERAFALWPNKGQADPRPEPGTGYRRIPPVPPGSPVLPDPVTTDPRPASHR